MVFSRIKNGKFFGDGSLADERRLPWIRRAKPQGTCFNGGAAGLNGFADKRHRKSIYPPLNCHAFDAEFRHRGYIPAVQHACHQASLPCSIDSLAYQSFLQQMYRVLRVCSINNELRAARFDVVTTGSVPVLMIVTNFVSQKAKEHKGE